MCVSSYVSVTLGSTSSGSVDGSDLTFRGLPVEMDGGD